ncbi:MAG: hypothetical protein ACT4OU_01835 [Hyphomicrobium sp.]
MMRRVALAVALATALTPFAALAKDLGLERGLAITDPEILERLERKGFSLVAMLSPGWRLGADAPLDDNRRLSAMPEMKFVFSGVDRAIKDTNPAKPGSGFGVGIQFNKGRLFDQRYLSALYARFALVGVVQRLDRAYKQAATCGEVRLLYRLEYQRTTELGLARSRLPMTFNLVFKAKDATSPTTCREIARRWIAAGDSKLAGDQLVAFLLSDNGPLSLFSPALIDRIETNLQSMRQAVQSTAKTIQMGGNAEYVLRVFDWSAASRRFNPALLENMIDRDKLLSDPALLARFKAWLFEPQNVRALDDGTLLIPADYLAIRGSSFAPGGHARSGNRPFYKMMSDSELAAAIKRVNTPNAALKNIASPAGYRMRLNDVTCVGCHQSRAIGGFHFMGADAEASKRHLPENAIFVPASAHFYGDAPRRRRVLDALAEGKTPDFGRAFSLRPSAAYATDRERNPTMNIHGTGFVNGWGGACYDHANKDSSFKHWTCKAGLRCVTTHETADDPGHGSCMTDGSAKAGDAVERGRIDSAAFRDDVYVRIHPKPGYPLTSRQIKIDDATYRATAQTGGFFGGMAYKRNCSLPMPSTTVCARHAGRTQPLPRGQENVGGFNDCLRVTKNFKECFGDLYTEKVGLRECDKGTPCRDDYICIATPDKTSGACLPPYFMMQFRVDGHPQ